MGKKEYVSSAEASKVLGVSTQTLRNWDKAGKIKTIRTPTGIRRYDLTSVMGESKGVTIIYARVSSYKQREDLERQAELKSKRLSPNNSNCSIDRVLREGSMVSESSPKRFLVIGK